MRLPNQKQHKWDDEFYVKAYQLALSGYTDARIASWLGVKKETFYTWIKEKPALASALEQARNRGSGTRLFMRYVTSKMPEDLRPLWETLCSDDPAVRERGLASAKQAGKREMQHLWVNAFVAMNFNHVRANEATNIGMITVMQWKQRDPEFKRLLEVVIQARGDFYENALVEKVAEGDTAAVIFANKTYNKERGYGPSMKIEMSGSVEDKRTITLGDLTVEEKRMLLDKLRSKKEHPQLEDNSNVVDAEFSLKEKEKE